MADITLNTTATVPANATLSVEVEEDTTGNGTADNAGVTTVSDGTNSHTMSGFDASSGNYYRTYQKFSTNSPEDDSASLDSWSITIANVATANTTKQISVGTETAALAKATTSTTTDIEVTPSTTALGKATVTSTSNQQISPSSTVTVYDKIFRTATTEGEGEAGASIELTEVFPSQSSADLTFSLIQSPVLGFASNWVYEEASGIPDDEIAAYTVVLDTWISQDYTIRIQYDATGDGNPDYTTEPRTVRRDNQTISFDALGDDGWYRIIISEMRPPDYLRAITWGPTRF